MSTPLGIEVRLALPFEQAIARVREALKQEGFAVLTEIDMRAAFREKLGKEFRPYVILGACNPPLAYAALTADPSIGLLLPCNATVESVAEGESVVRLTDPNALLGSAAMSGDHHLALVADDASARMGRVAKALAG